MPITYSLTNSAGGKFVLDGTLIKVAAALSAGVSTITILATDGAGWSKSFDIPITVGVPTSALGPTTATFTAGATAGTVIADITGLESGETIVSLTPDDGRLAISAAGDQLIVGLSASSVGTINAVLTSSSSRTLNITLTVEAEASAATFDFAANTYTMPSGAVTDPIADGLLTVTRPSALTVPTATGVYQTFAAGVLARNSLGLWMRNKTRTNYIRNSSMNGVVLGTPGTMPTGSNPIGWGTFSAPPSGITTSIVATGQTAPDLGLPYIDFHVTGTAATSSSWDISFGGNSQIPAVEGEVFAQSAWMCIVDGTYPSDGVSTIQLRSSYIGPSAQSLGGVATTYSTERITGRDVTPRRIVHRSVGATSTAYAVTYMVPHLVVAFKSAATYDFTLRIIAPQVEKLDSINEDASFPIFTTNAAVTATADTYSITGDALALLQGGSGAVEMTTTQLYGANLTSRSDQPLLKFNSDIALKRTADGRVASDLPGTPQTYKGWRSVYNWAQKHGISWTPSGVRVASTATRHVSAIASGTQPSITTAELSFTGCVSKITLQDNALTSMSAYQQITTDIAVYGATSGGIVAAARAKADSKNTIVIGGWRDIQPGGMATGGLAMVDASVTAINDAFGGMSLDYVRWCNEVGLKVNPDSKTIDCNIALRYFDYLINRYKIDIVWAKGVTTVVKSGTRITNMSCTLGQQVTAKAFIDASYEGDLMAAAGVSFTYGREAANANNPWNGNRGSQPYSTQSAGVSGHEFNIWAADGPETQVAVDPYITPGNPASGLVAGVQAGGEGTIDAADGALQAYNFRQTVTTITTDRYPIVTEGSPPPGYSAATYELLGRFFAALTARGQTAVSYTVTPGTDQYSLAMFLIFNQIGYVYDMNAAGGFSSDTFGMNWGAGWASIMTANGISSPSANYAVATYAEREIFWKWQENFTRGFWYYLKYSGDSRIPAQIVSDARLFDLSKSYYLDPHENDEIHWMPQMYVREARRMLGDLVLDAADISATDGTAPKSLNIISAGSYTIDSHHVRRYASVEGRAINEGNIFIIQGGNKTFPVAAEYVMPQQAECSNLCVTFAVSARHTGFGALRMELSHMAMSESSAIMLGQAISQTTQPDIQDWVTTSYTSDIRPAILAAGGVAPLTN